MFIEKARESVLQEIRAAVLESGGRILKSKEAELRLCLNEKNYIVKATEGMGFLLFTTGELINRSGKSIGMPKFNFISNGSLLASDRNQSFIEPKFFIKKHIERLMSQIK